MPPCVVNYHITTTVYRAIDTDMDSDLLSKILLIL